MKPLKSFDKKIPKPFKIVGALASISLAFSGHNVYAEESLSDLDGSDQITEIQDQNTDAIEDAQKRFQKRNETLEKIREKNIDPGEVDVKSEQATSPDVEESSDISADDLTDGASDDQAGESNQASGEGEEDNSDDSSLRANESVGTDEERDTSLDSDSDDQSSQPSSDQSGGETGSPIQPETPEEPSHPEESDIEEPEYPEEPSQPDDSDEEEPNKEELEDEEGPQESEDSDQSEESDVEIPAQEPQQQTGQQVDIEASLSNEELQMLIDVLLSQGPEEAERLQKSIIDNKIASGQAVYEPLPDTATGAWILGLLGSTSLASGLVLKRKD